MNINKKLHSITLASAALILFLILVSSTASAATAQSASSRGPFAYITNTDKNTVSVIDTATNTVTATVNLGRYAGAAAANPDGTKVYVANYDTNTVSVIDTATNTVTATIKVDNMYTSGVAVNPDGTKVYVVNPGSNIVSVIDTATNQVIDSINVECDGIAVNPTDPKLYISSPNSGTVYVIDTETNSVTNTVNVGGGPVGLVVNPSGTKVYVASQSSNIVSVIDTATNTVTATINVGNFPQDVAVNNDGTKVYVDNRQDNTVSVIDTATNTVTTTISVGNWPCGMALTRDGTKAYVANYNDGTVSVIDTTANKVIATVTVVDGSLGVVCIPALKPVLPVANFSSNVTKGYAPLTIQFTDTSTGTPTSWLWNFGDGTSSTDQNPVHTYSKIGKYTVSLTVENADGRNSTSKSNYINVVTPTVPSASFSASPTYGKAPLTVTFTDKSTNLPTSWNWNFGDGSVSTEQNPSYTYSKPGQYTVKLKVKNVAGSSAASKSNYIIVTNSLKPPNAAFSASSTYGKAPLTVTFTDKSTNSPDSWNWNFGDGSASTEQNPSHTYEKAGQYIVKLKVKNAAGSSTTSKSNYIVVTNPLKPPNAAFSASPISGKAPLTVTFTDKSTNSPDSWKWSFGDETSSTEQNPVHTYSNAGQYTVKVKVKNEAGSSTKTLNKYITVKK